MKILSDAADFMSGGTPNKANPAFWGGDIPWYSASNMTDRFIGNGSPKITYEGLIAGSKMAPKGSTLILVRGSGLFNYIPICYVEKAVSFNQDVKAICPKDDTDPVFLHFWMESLRNTLNQNLDVTGIGAGKLDTDFLKNLPFPDLSRKKQEYIAQYAQSFDRKIDLNRRTNETLEAMARALFRDWFVDFGPTRAKMAGEAPYLAPELWELFPDRLDDEGKPEGWLDGTLEDIANLQNGYAFKSSDWLGDGIPVVKIGAVKPSVVDLKNVSFVDSKFLKEKPNFILQSGDILIGLTGYVGEVGRVPPSQLTPMLNQRVARFLPEASFYAYIFCIGRQKEFKEFVENQAHGSAQANVSTKDVLTYPIVIPTMNLSALFDENIGLILEKIDENLSEIDTLTQLRDLLLPKLMSGEISIRDAEKMVEDAA